MTFASRNESIGFASRTLRNLELVKREFASSDQGHVVTQLVNSLLGLIVFPWERSFFNAIGTWKLVDLVAKEGWPLPQVFLDQPKNPKDTTETLKHLLWHMRNGIGHGRLIFVGSEAGLSADSRMVEAVAIQIEDAASKEGPVNWRACIRADQIEPFCRKLIVAVDELLG